MAVAVESSTIVPPTGIPDTGPVNPPAQRESLATRVAQILQRGGDAPALAERDREVVGDPETGETSLKLFPSFRTLSFKDVWQQVRDVAYDLYYDADAPLRPRVPIAFLGFCGIDYSVLEFAGHLLGAVIAPLQIDAPLSTLDPLIAELEPLIITVSIEQVDKAVELASNNKMVKRIIVFSYNADLSLERSIFDAAQAKLTARGVSAKLDSLDDIRQRRKDSPVPPLDMPEKGTDPLHLLVYTSGSTGTPKGAMITQRIMLRMWSPDWSQHTGGEVTLCYYPMNHILGQSTVAGSLVSGGICCFTAKSDMSTILEDLALVRPTKFTIVPRVGEMIYQWYLDEYNQRLKNGADPKTLESDLKIELRDKVMGGRIKFALVAGAKLKENITAFLAEVLDTFIEFGYGGTEMGGRVRQDKSPTASSD
ncbi:AMP-binding protein [Fonsecaea pedrosoi]|nr:AMP-binding protein [Fonsecaea pedrosoi]